MNFSQMILQKLRLTFKKYGLHVVEQQDNYLKLCSKYLVIIFVHDKIENSNTFWLGKNDDKLDKVEIDNSALKLFFHSDLKLSQVSVDTFVNNIVLFFENEGQPLFIGDLQKINELEKFDLERSRQYTQQFMDNQNLIAADKAWSKGDYDIFVALISQINSEELPTSYLLKYQFAKKQLKKYR